MFWFIFSGFPWNYDSIKLMLNLYKERKDLFQDGRIRKVKLWDEIAEAMKEHGYPSITGIACDKKFRNMKVTFMHTKDHNGSSGNDCRKWVFYQDFQDIFQKEHSVDPACVVNVGVCNGSSSPDTPLQIESFIQQNSEEPEIPSSSGSKSSSKASPKIHSQGKKKCRSAPPEWVSDLIRERNQFLKDVAQGLDKRVDLIAEAIRERNEILRQLNANIGEIIRNK
jgi:hypothetical protein